MEEGFALRAKKAVKKVAAFGAGLTMVGATLSGAFAVGTLAEYPAPFVSGGKFVDVAFVVGKDARSEDNLALTDLSGKLQATASGGSSSSTSTTITGGVRADVPLSKAIASASGNEFETSLENDDIDYFLDGTASFRGTDYDVSEELIISMDTTTNTTVYPQTSLTSSDDDYESGIFLEAARDSIKYFYTFDESIVLNGTSGVTADYPLEIDFLGKPLKITDVDTSDTKFTATVGDEYFMKVDDTVTVEGHTVTLMNVGSTGSIQVKVDDEVETISNDATKTFGSEATGIEIKNDEQFYDANDVTQRSATLIIGLEATETFKDNDEYPGYEDEWVWNVANIRGGTTTLANNASGIAESGIILSIENDFVADDDSDDPPGIGECYNLPNDYVSICLDGLTVADDDYMTLTMEFESGRDLTKAGFPTLTSEPMVYIHVDEDEGLVVDQSDLNWSNGTAADRKTDKIWIYSPGANSDLRVFYEDSNGDIVLAGNLTKMGITATFVGRTLFGHIDYGDVTSADMQLFAAINNGTTTLNISVVPYDSTDLTDYSDNITVDFSTSSNKFAALGASASSEEASEIRWVPSNYGTKPLGTKDEDHRTKYGIIVRDPKSHGASDEVVLEIPGDIVLADISISGSRTTTPEETGPGTSEEAPTAMLDSELTNPSQYNVITVGGPCINSVTADLLGVAAGTCGDASSGIEQDTAIIELKQQDGHWAMVVAGWEGEDTRRAGIVLKNYPTFFDSTTGSSVTVKGTGVSVSGITVE